MNKEDYDAFEKILKDLINRNPVMRKKYDQDGVGEYGEDLTVELLKQYIPGYFKIIRNLILPIGNTATEIDILMVHEKGIFVFESKNYGGWIFGQKNDQKWTQTFGNGQKYRFYNPIKQNKTHCDAICEVTRIPKQYVMSYIVFSERCSLKVVPENEIYLTIIKRNHMIKEIYKDLDMRNNVFTKEMVDVYYNGLVRYLDDEELKKKHHNNIEEKIRAFSKFKSGEESKKFENKKCPKCGKKLIFMALNNTPKYICPDMLGCGFTRVATNKDIENMSVEDLNDEVMDGVDFILEELSKIKF